VEGWGRLTGSDHHGGVILDQNSYGDLHSLVYHGRGPLPEDVYFLNYKFESEHLSENDDFGYYASDLYPAKVLCFVKAGYETIHAIIHCCIASDHSEDSILVECWKKE